MPLCACRQMRYRGRELLRIGGVAHRVMLPQAQVEGVDTTGVDTAVTEVVAAAAIAVVRRAAGVVAAAAMEEVPVTVVAEAAAVVMAS